MQGPHNSKRTVVKSNSCQLGWSHQSETPTFPPPTVFITNSNAQGCGTTRGEEQRHFFALRH